ncbi:MAG: hypothetical protein II833_00345, partial [Pseudobutyrivibrio sp.]|nr:hypothetical protein [Pseudobutyrivibrio sp.]
MNKKEQDKFVKEFIERKPNRCSKCKGRIRYIGAGRYECFDCGNENPDFISANNCVFICKQCMAVHYQFTDEVSLIIKNNLFLLN